MSRRAGWIALAALAACDRTAPQESAAPAVASATASAEVHLPRYRPPGGGGPEAFMEAGMGGTLVREGACLGFAGAAGAGFSTIVWPADARLGADDSGLFVALDGERFRPGEFLIGGGGTMPADFSDRVLERPFPAACDRSRAVEFHSIERRRTGFTAPPQAPPPPPAR